LLNHTAGWSKRSFGDPMFIPQRVASYTEAELPVDLDKIMEFVLSNHLPYRPGTYYDYSNFGYCVLGKVIERVSGMSYEDYVQTEILRPLGITSMKLAKTLPEDKAPYEAMYYDNTYNNMRPALDGSDEKIPSPYGFDIEALSAAGGWLATPVDLLKFLTAIDGFKNTPDILTNHSLLTMTSPERGQPYGWRYADDQGTWWRTGTLAGTSAMMKRKENGISWVVITNTSNRRSGSFPSRINWLMDSQLEKIAEWPERDFFAMNY
jgi:CubicO group peptidase (beta-lactamase class C family)